MYQTISRQRKNKHDLFSASSRPQRPSRICDLEGQLLSDKAALRVYTHTLPCAHRGLQVHGKCVPATGKTSRDENRAQVRIHAHSHADIGKTALSDSARKGDEKRPAVPHNGPKAPPPRIHAHTSLAREQTRVPISPTLDYSNERGGTNFFFYPKRVLLSRTSPRPHSRLLTDQVCSFKWNMYSL